VPDLSGSAGSGPGAIWVTCDGGTTRSIVRARMSRVDRQQTIGRRTARTGAAGGSMSTAVVRSLGAGVRRRRTTRVLRATSGAAGRGVSRRFEELDRQVSPIGEISLRRRLEPSLQIDVFEVKIGEDGLMSSLITDGEEAVATLGLAATSNAPLDVVVGGLGLGYTARAALADPRVRSLRVVEALAPVIEWHRRHLVPLGSYLTSDERCELVHDDFFGLAASGLPFGGDAPSSFDAVLVDIDHSPRHLLKPGHAAFYTPTGMDRLAACLRPGGVFSLWSNDPPDDAFLAVLAAAFDRAAAEVVTFPNVLTGGETSSTIYVATR
jgi:hypothetical protein